MLIGAKRLHAWAVCASLVLGSLLPVAGAAPAACAGEGPRAALVVDTDEAVQRFCVKLPDDRVSGLELIVLAHEQHGLSYRFGHGGGAVCMLANVGAAGDDCFERYPDFWGYWRGSPSGTWAWSSSGAGSTSVGDGDVEGWSWGSGNDGNSHRRPPETSFASVCPAAAPVKDEPERHRPRPASEDRPPDGSGPPLTPSARPVAAPTSVGEVAAPRSQDRGPRGPRSKRERGRERTRPAPVVTETEPPDLGSEPAAAVQDDESDPGGLPPASGIAALGAAAVLGGAGFVLARRRRRGP